MSGVIKALGKAFKKVVKVAKKVAIPALAIGAIVLTGGAAAGLLPSLGTMIGGLGLSAGLTSALTGAISTGALGAVGGLLTGGFKGMKSGFLMGAATGGVLGGIGAIGPNGILGGGKAAAGAGAKALSSGPGISSSITGASLAAPTSVPALGLPAPGVLSGGIGAAALPAASANVAQLATTLPAVPSLAAPVGTAAAAPPSGGIGGFMAQNPMLTMMAGQALTGLATPSASSEAAKAEAKQGANLFSGAYSNGGFGQPGSYSVPSNLKANQPTKRFRLNRQTMEVEEVG